jgi:hypothetical protein
MRAVFSAGRSIFAFSENRSAHRLIEFRNLESEVKHVKFKNQRAFVFQFVDDDRLAARWDSVALPVTAEARLGSLSSNIEH